VSDGVGVKVSVGVAVGGSVGVAVNVSVGVKVDVYVGDGDSTGVLEDTSVDVPVGVEVLIALLVGTTVGVTVDASVGVIVVVRIDCAESPCGPAICTMPVTAWFSLGAARTARRVSRVLAIRINITPTRTVLFSFMLLLLTVLHYTSDGAFFSDVVPSYLTIERPLKMVKMG
jgi:hypothetical protein